MHRRNFIKGVGVAMGATFSLPVTAASPVERAAQRGAKFDAQALEDTLLGSSYLGCGGGGSLEAARELIRSDLAEGISFSILDVAQLGDDDWVASPYALESLAPVDPSMRDRLEKLGVAVDEPVTASFRLLEDYLGKKFSAVIVGEIGPLSMAEALSLAARLGVPSLDADTVGRATPEINQHSVRVAGHAITPAAAVSQFGDEVILKSVADPSREEDVFRALSVVSRLVGVTDAAIPGAVAKADNVLVQKSLGLAASIGKAVREAMQGGSDPVEAARAAGDGYLLFEGVVGSSNWADSEGFLVGDVTVHGTGAFQGQSLLLDYKNEHLVARRNGEVIATCPDLITMIDRKSYEGIGNPDFSEGQAVSVLAYRAASLWRRPEGLDVFAPRYFGYDVDYIPVEQRLSVVNGK